MSSKGEDGRAYTIDGKIFRDANGACFTSNESIVYLEFPCFPPSEIVDVHSENLQEFFDEIDSAEEETIDTDIDNSLVVDLENLNEYLAYLQDEDPQALIVIESELVEALNTVRKMQQESFNAQNNIN